MPRLMEKTDWIQTVADVGIAENVWYENIVGDADSVSFPLPERGRYRVILVKLEGDLNPRPISCSKQKRKYLHASGLFAARQGRISTVITRTCLRTRLLKGTRIWDEDFRRHEHHN